MLGVITANFLFNIESRMKIVVEQSFASLLEDMWYPKLCRTINTDGKSERVNMLIGSASLDQLTPADGGENAGSTNYDQYLEVTTEYFPAAFGKSYKINKLKYLNSLNGGQDPLMQWARDIATQGAYYPQWLAAGTLLNGGTAIGPYDGVSFFNKLHPIHPLIPSLGTYANDFTGAAAAASGATPAYPGACPIDDTVSMDIAFANLQKVLSYIRTSVRLPNNMGMPRKLKPKFILSAPRSFGRISQLLKAQTIAQTAGTSATAGGGADAGEIFKKWMLAEPVQADELAGGVSINIAPINSPPVIVTGSDTTYYVVCEEANKFENGGLLRYSRLPFTMHTYSGESGTDGIDAILGRSQELEYRADMYESVNYGLPYTIFRCQGS